MLGAVTLLLGIYPKEITRKKKDIYEHEALISESQTGTYVLTHSIWGQMGRIFQKTEDKADHDWIGNSNGGNIHSLIGRDVVCVSCCCLPFLTRSPVHSKVILPNRIINNGWVIYAILCLTTIDVIEYLFNHMYIKYICIYISLLHTCILERMLCSH